MKRRISYLQQTIILNSLIVFAWWVLFNPGFYSADSFGVLENVRKGQISSESTAIWAILVKVISLNGARPELATLFFSQILALSTSIFAHSLFDNKVGRLASACLCLTPLIGAMGITLWHDIPMTSGFLLGVAGVQRIVKKQPQGFSLILFGVFLSSFRYNGIPTILVTCLLLLVISEYKYVFASIFMIASAIGILTSALDVKYSPVISTHSDGFINWMRYDLSCYAAKLNNDEFFHIRFGEMGPREFWKSERACTWFNDSDAFYIRPKSITEKIPSAWLDLAKKHPTFVLKTHLERHAYLVPIPFYGVPEMPFIHTTIEYSNRNVKFWKPNLSEKLRFYPRIWNYFRGFFGFAGLWLFLIFLTGVLSRNTTYLGIAIFGLVLHSGLFIFAIISDARFALFVLISGQLILLGECIKYLQKKFRLKDFLT